MRLKLQTDYALRVLLTLGRSGESAPVGAIAEALEVSHDHLVKVVQRLAREGWVTTRPGRGGGVALSADPATITVADVVGAFEGRQQVLDCVLQPETCVLEPGCSLRRLLMSAEDAFFDVLADKTIADLCGSRSRTGGLANISLP